MKSHSSHSLSSLFSILYSLFSSAWIISKILSSTSLPEGQWLIFHPKSQKVWALHEVSVACVSRTVLITHGLWCGEGREIILGRYSNSIHVQRQSIERDSENETKAILTWVEKKQKIGVVVVKGQILKLDCLVLILALFLAHCVILHKLLKLSVPPFFRYVKKEDDR